MINLRLVIFSVGLGSVIIASVLYIVMKLERQIQRQKEQTCHWYDKFVSMEKLCMQLQHDYSLLQYEYKALEEEHKKLNEENKRPSSKRTRIDTWLL